MSTEENHLRSCGKCGGKGTALAMRSPEERPGVYIRTKFVIEECGRCGGRGVVCRGYSATTTSEGPPCASCHAEGCPMRREEVRA